MMNSFRKEMGFFNAQLNIANECKYLAWLCRGMEEFGGKEDGGRYTVHSRTYSSTLQIWG